MSFSTRNWSANSASDTGTGANVTSDADLAALAVEHGAELVSHDAAVG